MQPSLQYERNNQHDEYLLASNTTWLSRNNGKVKNLRNFEMVTKFLFLKRRPTNRRVHILLLRFKVKL